MLTRTTLAGSFRELGLYAGAGVMVHSSLRSFGHVEGGAQTVVLALMDVITPEGTLMMPSFNHGDPWQEDSTYAYDPRTTRSTNGAIPNALWPMPDVLRSLDPTHPFAAWGQHAQRYTQFHHRTLTMGPASPLGLMLQDDGYVLLLGVDYTSNTFHHCVEMMLNTPCLGKRCEAYAVQLPDGRRVMGRTWGWRNASCPFTDSNRYADVMAERGLHKQRKIGECTATLFKMRDCFDVVSEILRNGRDGFPPCAGCPIRPRVVEHTVESDWDEAMQSLKPNSVAWTY
jgi:aminoglycoside 3-N-acetyltransferase